MKNKQLKFWLFAFIWTLLVVGATAYYFSEKRNFYLGQAVFNGKEAMSSVLGADASATSAEKKVRVPVPQSAAKATTQKSKEKSVAPSAKSKPIIASPCPSGGAPVLKGGKIIGCTTHE